MWWHWGKIYIKELYLECIEKFSFIAQQNNCCIVAVSLCSNVSHYTNFLTGNNIPQNKRKKIYHRILYLAGRVKVKRSCLYK
jgi:hypothetical protein